MLGGRPDVLATAAPAEKQLEQHDQHRRHGFHAANSGACPVFRELRWQSPVALQGRFVASRKCLF
jgi:hypothetical protein